MDSKTATNLLSTKTLVQFGLNRQPFMDKGNNRYIFEDSAISTQINVLINIIHGSDKIVMIKGENGVGKSSLLHKLAKIRHKGLTFCPIKATDKVTIESLCKTALKHLEIPAPSSSASIPEFFAKRVAFRRRTEGKTVLLIDDADQLDSYTIDQLLLLRKLVAEDGVPAISIVFSGHPQLEQILTALPRINNHLSILHTIYLYPFSEKQTTDYINQRLQFACNNQDIELLTPAQIQSIHNRSKGIPALINYETCKILETIASKGKNPIETQTTDTGKTSQLIPAILITVATLSLGFIGYLVYSHIQQFNQNQEPTSVVAEAITIPSKIVTPFKQAPINEQPAIATSTDEKSQIPADSVTPVNEPVEELQEVLNEQPAIETNGKDELEKKEDETVASKPKVQELATTTSSKATETKKLKTDKQLAATITEDAKKADPKIKVEAKIGADTTPEKTVLEKAPSEETIKSKAVEKQINTPKKQAKEKTQQVSTQKPSAEKTTTDAKQLATAQTKIAQAKTEETKKLPAAKPTAKTTADVKPATNKTKPAAKAKQVAATVKSAPTSKAPKPSFTTDNKVKSWITQQPPSNYTMQLLAAQSDAALIKYKQQNPSLKEAKIALTLRKGKSWYVLIVGSFKTTKEATAYLSKQPAPISKSKPWIRRFKTLQKTLK